MNETKQNSVATAVKSVVEVNEIAKDEISSPVLLRLIEEVRNEETRSINAYNRLHNRHNRSR